MLQTSHNISMIPQPTDRLSSAAPSFDLMLRRENDMYVPAIFINKALPNILCCISRELQSLRNELCLMRKFSGRVQTSQAGPLASWYLSIFEDIFLDVPLEKWVDEGVAQDLAGFSLPAITSLPIPCSSYQYVSLILPPLWKTDKDYRPDVAHPRFRYLLPVMNPSGRTLCHFRYAKAAGVWYASLESPRHKKRIFQRHASPEDSYRVLQNAGVGNLT